jgi:hypothetical protein
MKSSLDPSNATVSPTAWFEDLAGLRSPVGPKLTVTIDPLAPAAPTVAPDLTAASDTGASDTDNVTSVKQPVFTIAGGTPYFRVYRNGALVSGSYATGATFTAPTQADGTMTYTFTVVDAAGNESAPGPGVAVTVLTVKPAAPAKPAMAAASDLGASNSDAFTSARQPVFNLPAGGSRYKVFMGGVFVADLPAGTAAYTPAAPLADGTYSLTLSAVDGAGNESAQGPALSFKIETVAPAVTTPDPAALATPYSLQLAFTEAMNPTIDPGLVTVTGGPAAGDPRHPSGATYDAATRTLTFRFDDLLADGDYHAAFAPGAVTDVAGNPLAAAFEFDFAAFAGDATRDRNVDFNDLVALARNYNVTDGLRTWVDGDFTGDGNVDFNDLVKLAQNYNTSLAGAASAPATPPLAFADAMAAAFATATPSATPTPVEVRPKPAAGKLPVMATPPAPVAKPVKAVPKVTKAVAEPVSSAGTAAKSQLKGATPAPLAAPATLALPPASAFGTARIKAGTETDALW